MNTVNIKISGYRSPASGNRFRRSVKGVDRLLEVVEIVSKQDRGDKLHPMYTVKCAIIADVLQ